LVGVDERRDLDYLTHPFAGGEGRDVVEPPAIAGQLFNGKPPFYALA